VSEVANLLGAIYHSDAQASQLVDDFGLNHVRHRFCHELSSGERQRLAVALAFVGNPEVVFLDEPSSGLDAQTREMLYGQISQARSVDRTVVLTTHYLEEAAALCNRVAILHEGRMLAIGTITELRGRFRPETEVLARWAPNGAHQAHFAGFLPGAHFTIDEDGFGLRISTVDPAQAICAIVRGCDALHLHLVDLDIKRALFQDVFLKALGSAKSAES
jgi:ABC-2 type transport system ATP-binding protein